MAVIKLIRIGNALDDMVFHTIEDVVDWLKYDPRGSYILVINGRRYEWPEGEFYVQEHLADCIDLDEAFYANT